MSKLWHYLINNKQLQILNLVTAHSHHITEESVVLRFSADPFKKCQHILIILMKFFFKCSKPIWEVEANEVQPEEKI